MLCDHYEYMKISQDVLKKYRNILGSNENHFRYVIQSEKISSVQNHV